MSKFSLILLAAGDSTRMGQPKGLLDFNGHPWLIEQLVRIHRAGGRRVVLVAASAAGEYRSAVASAKLPDDLEVIEVKNPEPQNGIFSSLRCGLRAVTSSESRAFVLPIDVPCSDPRVFSSLESAMGPGVLAALPTFRGRGGHPVLLSPEFMTTLLSIPLNLDARLDIQLHRLNSAEMKRIEVMEPSITMNLNSPEDWQKFVATPHSA